MKPKTRYTFIGLIVLIALITSVALPITALADEAPTPPPSSDSSGSSQPVDPSAPAVDTSVPAQPADTSVPVVDTSSPAQATDTTVATQDAGAAVVTDTQAPADTTSDTNSPAATATPVVVINSTGTVEPLATQAAADIIATDDPMWCPSGVTPGGSGCTSSATTVADLITAIGAGSKTGAGTVYFTSNYDTNDATFDHNDINLNNLTALTIQGGWNGSTGAAFTLSGVSTFSVPLSVVNWTDNVTINDISISGTAADGLTVNTTGNIRVHHVASNLNNGAGAYLDNTYSDNTDNIEVDNSTFNGNGGACFVCDSWDGLDAYSNGNITLTEVTANGNYGDGAYLDNTYGENTGNIEVDNSTFGDSSGENGNGYNGLEVYSYGNVALNTVTADYNDSDGALLGDVLGGEAYYEIGGTITVTGGDFSNNGDDSDSWNPAGLEAYADGAITLTSVTANGNYGDGAYLDNTYGENTGNIEVDNSTFGDSSGENGNGYNGLEVYSYGNVALNTVTADYNDSDGALLGEFPFFEDYHSEIGGTITITGSDFSNNNQELDGPDGFIIPAGLEAFADNAITLNNVSADNNLVGAVLFAGIYLDPDIEINNSQFNSNWLGGLYAVADGNIILNNTVADNNSDGEEGEGAILDATDDVTVNCGHYDNNGATGIDDEGSTSLTLNGVELSGNSDPYLYDGIAVIGTDCSGGHTPHAGAFLPIHTINVTGGEDNGLDCTQYGGTQLILPNNDSALFPCPISDSASLGSTTSDKLPGTLPGGDTFVSAFTTKVIKNGASSSPVASPITVSFAVPDSMKNSKLAILYWDGSKWVEVSGHMSPDGHFEATTDLTGTFVLVSK